MDYSKFKFRASSMGALLKESKSKSETFGETSKKYMVSLMIENQYGRSKEIYSKFLEKGIQVEEDSITLLSRVKKKFFLKNEENLNNDFFTGTPDLYEGENIKQATAIYDIKSSFDIWTFYNSKMSPLNKDYEAQLNVYMDLTGAKVSYLAYCLVDTPDFLIEDEIRRMKYKIGALTDTDPEYMFAEALIRKNMTYSDIDLKKRVHIVEVPRNEELITKMKERVIFARKWMTENPI